MGLIIAIFNTLKKPPLNLDILFNVDHAITTIIVTANTNIMMMIKLDIDFLIFRTNSVHEEQFLSSCKRRRNPVLILSQVSYPMSLYHLPNVLSRYSDNAVFCSRDKIFIIVNIGVDVTLRIDLNVIMNTKSFHATE
jgi:hypothetical protein